MNGVTAVAARMLLLVLAAALVASGGIGGHVRPSAAQQPGLTIPVYDYTAQWREHIKSGVAAWDAALAPRGIRLTYSRQTPTLCEQLAQPASGISICDTALPPTDHRWAEGEFQGIWASERGIQMRGIARFFEDPQNSDFDAMVVCHEIGHTLQLPHVAQGTDSCMAPMPEQRIPSAWDSANALATMPDDLEPMRDGIDRSTEKKEARAKEREAKAEEREENAKEREANAKERDRNRKKAVSETGKRHLTADDVKGPLGRLHGRGSERTARPTIARLRSR